MTGPAALPIIVVKPPSRPKRAEYHHLCIHLFPFPKISLQIITAIARASVQPISWRNPCAGMSLSTKSATRKPNKAVGKSFVTIFQSAIRAVSEDHPSYSCWISQGNQWNCKIEQIINVVRVVWNEMLQKHIRWKCKKVTEIIHILRNFLLKTFI